MIFISNTSSTLRIADTDTKEANSVIHKVEDQAAKERIQIRESADEEEEEEEEDGWSFSMAARLPHAQDREEGKEDREEDKTEWKYKTGKAICYF